MKDYTDEEWEQKVAEYDAADFARLRKGKAPVAETTEQEEEEEQEPETQEEPAEQEEGLVVSKTEERRRKWAEEYKRRMSGDGD